MQTAFALNFPGAICLNAAHLIFVQHFLQSNIFIKSFYLSRFFLLRAIAKCVLFSYSSLVFNFFKISRLWLTTFNYFHIIGFELWGLGLNYFLLNKYTKLGKKYKEKKKKITKLSRITISLKKLLVRLKFTRDSFVLTKRLFFFSLVGPAGTLTHRFNGFRFNVVRLRRKFSFKLGFSHRIGFFEPLDLRIIDQKKASDFRRKRFFLVSSNFTRLKNVSIILRYLKGLNIYKFRGMKFIKEDIELRIGKVGRL